MKADTSYHCSECTQLLAEVDKGTCPVCGSRAVIPVGWYQISTEERGDWLRRIRGHRPKKGASRQPRLP